MVILQEIFPHFYRVVKADTLIMLALVASFLSLTFGLLGNKLRDCTSGNLREGDLTDDICRQFINRELDCIHSMLDGLARRDLLSSISFLKEGLRLLNLSFAEANDDRIKRTQTEAIHNHGEERHERIQVSEMQGNVENRQELPYKEMLQDISSIIRNLGIASKERLACAKMSFADSRREATRAFSNKTLPTKDRIMATKLRVVSRILENLEDPVAAIDACKLYLEELHDLGAVREIFFVHFCGGFRSRFNKTRRLEVIASVITISYTLVSLNINFAKKHFALLNWPVIKLPQRTIHPVMDVEVRSIMNKFMQEAPNVFTFNKPIYQEVNYSNGIDRIMQEILQKSDSNIVLASISEDELHFSFREMPDIIPAKEEKILHAVTMDKENIYAITCAKSKSNRVQFILCLSDKTGNNAKELPLEFLTVAENNYRETLLSDLSEELLPLGVSGVVELLVTESNKIVLGHQLSIYICNTTGQLLSSFQTMERNDLMCATDANEIVSAKYCGTMVYIYTEGGEIQRQFTAMRGQQIYDVVFNHLTKKIFLLISHLKTVFLLGSYSSDGEHLVTLPLHFSFDFRALSILPEGPLAVVHERGFVLI